MQIYQFRYVELMLIDGGEHPPAAGIGGQPVVTAESHRLILQGHWGESPPIAQRSCQSSLREVSRPGEHPATVPPVTA